MKSFKEQGTQDMFETIIASITDGFFVLDEAWRFVYLNAQAETFWGGIGKDAGRRTHPGENVWEAFPEAVGGEAYTLYHGAVQDDVAAVSDLYVASWEQWFSLRTYPFSDGLSVLVTEITEQKIAEKERRARTKTLEQQVQTLQEELTASREGEKALLQAVQGVTEDAAWLGHSVLEQLTRMRTPKADIALDKEGAALSPRERQVLERIAKGQANPQIAAELGLAEQTVRNYITRLYKKLGVHSRAEAVVWAQDRGLQGF